jgi:uncharacterized protein YbjT (DUF2867 family)
MGHSAKAILVIGATGQQGGAVVQALQPTPFAIRALVRPGAFKRSRSQSVSRLEQQGVQIMPGYLDDVESLRRAMAGAYGVFSVTTFRDKGVLAEVERGQRAVDAAKQAGVQHFVYSSVGGAERNSGIPHFESKWRVEQHLRGIGLPYSIVRPTTFMTNLYALPGPIRFLALSMLRSSNGERPLQMIAVPDIGKWVARMFLRPELYLSQAVEIAGDEVTFAEMLAAYQKVYGRRPKSVRLPKSLFSGGDAGKMIAWMSREGYQADLRANRAAIPDLLTYEAFLALNRLS